jgi:acetyltransferase-like isoleucine patch superfamily enzyme
LRVKFSDRVTGMMAETKEVVHAGREELGRRRLRRHLLAAATGIQIDRSVEVRSPDRLILGPRVVVDRGVLLHCGGMDWSPPDGGVSLGAHSYVGPNCVLFGAGGIEIGEAVLISPGVVITSHQHSFKRSDQDMREQPLDFGKVIVGRDVWIGANATILPSVRIGPGSVIGAGAVVTGDIPAGVVALGVPARVSRER